ncbi:hypothetical protein BDY24DRAFT_370350 [Mrakia frigida]|uniref:uncharacterized protein n=1 Tax=Mrakia frigida TaxID=29902 RepID=UPI003FCC192F
MSVSRKGSRKLPISYRIARAFSTSPLSARKPVLSNLTFSTTETSYTLPSLPLGAGVEFIALLQDSVDGADGGRVSQVVKVSDGVGNGTSCLDNLDHSLDSTFSVSTTTPTQCGDFQITWESSATNPIGLTGLIPGGMSFDVPITDLAGRTASWPFRVLAGSQVMFAMSDGGTKGSAGSSPLYTVGAGSESCISGAANSEAAVIYSSLPVGDVPTTLTVYATLTVSGGVETVFATASATPNGNGTGSGSSSSGNSNLSGGSNHAGAIAGGVVGGVGGLLLLAGLIWFCVRKRDKQRRIDEKASQNDMMAAGRPWSPPLPTDPESNPIYQPSPAFFNGNGNGNGNGNHSSSALGGTAPGSTHGSTNSLSSPANSNFGGGLNSFAPSAFAHVPPGGLTGSSSGGHGSESEGRLSSEKRGLYTGPSSMGGLGSSDGEDSPLRGPGTLGEDNRRDSGTRFVRHEDAGAVPQAPAATSPDEVVDLPPLYQDAGERASTAGH